jgi:hypothetical protein
MLLLCAIWVAAGNHGANIIAWKGCPIVMVSITCGSTQLLVHGSIFSFLEPTNYTNQQQHESTTTGTKICWSVRMNFVVHTSCWLLYGGSTLYTCCILVYLSCQPINSMKQQQQQQHQQCSTAAVVWKFAACTSIRLLHSRLCSFRLYNDIILILYTTGGSNPCAWLYWFCS